MATHLPISKACRNCPALRSWSKAGEPWQAPCTRLNYGDETNQRLPTCQYVRKGNIPANPGQVRCNSQAFGGNRPDRVRFPLQVREVTWPTSASHDEKR